MILLVFLAQTLRIVVPYLLAAAGGVMSERVGVAADRPFGTHAADRLLVRRIAVHAEQRRVQPLDADRLVALRGRFIQAHA